MLHVMVSVARFQNLRQVHLAELQLIPHLDTLLKALALQHIEFPQLRVRTILVMRLGVLGNAVYTEGLPLKI